MADINLLQNTGNQKKVIEGGSIPSFLGPLGVVIFILVALVTGVFYYLSSHESGQVQALAEQQQAAEQKVIDMPNYQKFLDEQNSLSLLSGLLANHPDWSKVPTQFAGVTLHSITYTSIAINQDGTVTIQGTAPTFSELDKFVEALNDKTISPFISQVSVQNVSIASTTTGTSSTGVQTSNSGVTFSIVVAFNHSIWQQSTVSVPTTAPSGTPVSTTTVNQ